MAQSSNHQPPEATAPPNFLNSHVSPNPRRTLAAIVFTDVVDYSGRVGEDEARTVASVQRDLALIRTVCVNSGGEFLKAMGDGALLRFPSAIQAVEFAVLLQSELEVASNDLDPADVLDHRIGVHLGDIVQTDLDVFGDGVNIAARLMDGAPPRSIYISRLVYDVAKSQIPQRARYVGLKKFKGIKDAIGVWELPPLSRGRVVVSESRAKVLATKRRRQFLKRFCLAVAAACVLIATGFGIKTVLHNRQLDEDARLHQIRRQKRAHGEESALAGPVSSDPNSKDLAAQSRLTDAEFRAIQSEDPALFARLKGLFEGRDFQGMADQLQGDTVSSSPKGQILIQECLDLAGMMGWLDNSLDSTTKDRPVTVANFQGESEPVDIYRSGPGVVNVRTEEATKTMNVGEFTVSQIQGIAASILDLDGVPANRGQIESAFEELQILSKQFEESSAISPDRPKNA